MESRCAFVQPRHSKTAADLNLDGLNVVGRTRDIGVPGAERSSLYDTAAVVAKKMGLKLAPTIPDLSGRLLPRRPF
jgi:Zn-dependent M28 family amino/carboxypeptidase